MQWLGWSQKSDFRSQISVCMDFCWTSIKLRSLDYRTFFVTTDSKTFWTDIFQGAPRLDLGWSSQGDDTTSGPAQKGLLLKSVKLFFDVPVCEAENTSGVPGRLEWISLKELTIEKCSLYFDKLFYIGNSMLFFMFPYVCKQLECHQMVRKVKNYITYNTIWLSCFLRCLSIWRRAMR